MSLHRTSSHPQHSRVAALSLTLFICFCLSIEAWLSSSQLHKPIGTTRILSSNTLESTSGLLLSSSTSRDVVDADFERVDNSQPKKKTKKDKKKSSKAPTAIEDADTDDTRPKTLLDLSLELDPDWKEARIPFVNGENSNYIDAKLAFTVDVDGVMYGIGVPFDHAAAIVLEQADGNILYLSPDDDDNVELMEIMAGQLKEHIDEDLKLQRTPRILTISGNLSKYTDKWQDELVPKPVEIDKLLDDADDESIESFREFMRQELGEEEYTKTIKEAAAMSNSFEDVEDDLMKLFNIPGMGESKDDEEGIENLLKSMFSGSGDVEEMPPFPSAGGDGKYNNLDHDGVALKLISYKLGGGKSYSLVHLLKPFMLVGKYVKDAEADNEIRFELLQPEDEKIVIPKIEELCRDDMRRAGLTTK